MNEQEPLSVSVRFTCPNCAELIEISLLDRRGYCKNCLSWYSLRVIFEGGL